MCQSAAKQYCYCQIKRLQLSGVNNSDPFTVAVDWDLTEKKSGTYSKNSTQKQIHGWKALKQWQ